MSRVRRLEGLKNLSTETLENRQTYHQIRLDEVKRELSHRYGDSDVMFSTSIEEANMQSVEREIHPDRSHYQDVRHIEDDTTQIGEVRFVLDLNRPMSQALLDEVAQISASITAILDVIKEEIKEEVALISTAKEVRPKKK